MVLFRSRLFGWAIKLPVTCFYLAFFAVQIFFNLDIAQKQPVHHQASGFVQAGAAQNAKLKQDAGTSVPKSKVRLNKRFQPSSIPVIFHDLPLVSVVYARLKPSALAPGNLYSFVFLSSHALRGPPVVA